MLQESACRLVAEAAAKTLVATLAKMLADRTLVKMFLTDKTLAKMLAETPDRTLVATPDRTLAETPDRTLPAATLAKTTTKTIKYLV